MKISSLIVFLLLAKSVFAQQIFHNLPSFLQYADVKSISFQSSIIKEQQAKKAKLAALIGIADPQGNNNVSFINNTKLPVSVLPADAFGGTAGTTREIQTGTKYNTAVQNTMDIKIINLEGWKNLKLSELNLEIIETDSRLIKKSLYEDIATTYYNIVQLQEQQTITQRNIKVCDSLLSIVQNKYNEGLVKLQDVNDSKVNLLTITENEKQIAYHIQQNYLSLKILADIPENEIFRIDEIVGDVPFSKPEIEKNYLSLSKLILKEKYALQDFKRNKLSTRPTLSFVANQAFNQFNQDFTIAGGNWISSNYVGFKLTIPMVSAASIANKFNAKFNYKLAQQNSIQAAIHADVEYQKLEIAWNKAQSQVYNHAQIVEIQKVTYAKNKNLYTEGLQSIDRTLNSLNTLINAEYNLISSKVSVLLAQAKIYINNQIK